MKLDKSLPVHSDPREPPSRLRSGEEAPDDRGQERRRNREQHLHHTAAGVRPPVGEPGQSGELEQESQCQVGGLHPVEGTRLPSGIVPA